MDQGDSVKLELEKTVSKMSTNQKDTLLRYSTSWNTNSRHCHQAQMVLNILIANHTPEELLSLPAMKGALAGLLMYNDRHMQRLVSGFFYQFFCANSFMRDCLLQA